MFTRKLFHSHIRQSHFAILQRWHLLVAAIQSGMLLLFVTPTASASPSPACPGPHYLEVPSSTQAPAVGDTVTYRVTGLTEGTTYSFEVTAVDTSDLESACSNEASGTPQQGGYINLVWDAPTTNVDGTPITDLSGYRVYAVVDPPAGGGGGGGCFIATAAYGSPLAPQVQRLREVRDRFLLPNRIGRAFVSIYYKLSPPLAEVIARSETLRFIVRMTLLPIIAWAAIILWSPVVGLGFVVLAMLMGTWLVLRLMIWRRPNTQPSARAIHTVQARGQHRSYCSPRPVRPLVLAVILFLGIAIPTLLLADQGGNATTQARVTLIAEIRLPELTRFALLRDPETEHLGLHKSGEPFFLGRDPIPLGRVMDVREDSMTFAVTGGERVEVPKGGRLPGRRVVIFERSVLLDALRFQVRHGTSAAPPGFEYSVVEVAGRQAILQRDALPGEGQATGVVVAEARRPAESPVAPSSLGTLSPLPSDKMADLVNRMPIREVTPDTWEIPAKDAMALESHVGELLDETLRLSTLRITSQSGVALKVDTALGGGTLDRQGFLINNVKLSKRMGLEIGDRILSVNDHPVNSLASLYQLYRSLKSDPSLSEVRVVVSRKNQLRTLTYRLR